MNEIVDMNNVKNVYLSMIFFSDKEVFRYSGIQVFNRHEIK